MVSKARLYHRAVQTIIQNLVDLWAIQEIDDTTAFKGMIDAIDGYEYVYGRLVRGLVCVYNACH